MGTACLVNGTRRRRGLEVRKVRLHSHRNLPISVWICEWRTICQIIELQLAKALLLLQALKLVIKCERLLSSKAAPQVRA